MPTWVRTLEGVRYAMSRADRVRLDDRLEHKPLPEAAALGRGQPQPPGRCVGYDYFLSTAFAEGQERGRRAHGAGLRNVTEPNGRPKINAANASVLHTASWLRHESSFACFWQLKPISSRL